eukprot:gnl/TRDRNA2_/TRDRNA2_29088_c0_seq1.p1 gnl/TRDRNA2_/TRDRNA2_29088_c0~~gnl/TRDRNA2_/TRDRNA2_29088_c0_seq1.p1  ORF type:complete len:278 (+),score=53.78 gnl/TRDRNA2_/TRDRNA2_29088_c0_seq1:55-888(+)
MTSMYPPPNQQFVSYHETAEDEEHGRGPGGFCDAHAQDSSEEEALYGKVHEMPAYIRSGFIQKVYMILVVQIIITVSIAAPFNSMIPREWLMANTWLFQLAMFGSLALVLGMACCCRNAARQFPTNYLLLFGFTILEAVVIGFVTAQYQTSAVIQAALITAGIFMGLTIFACVTKSDFTGMGPYLMAALTCLMCFALVIMICDMCGLYSPLATKIYAGIGALLFSFYIIYDTQLIVGGRHRKFQLDVDDYVFAALNLYLDIINLFMMLLSLTGGRQN